MDSKQLKGLVTALEKFHDIDPKMPLRQVICLLTIAQNKGESLSISDVADQIQVGVAVASRYVAAFGRGARDEKGLGFLAAKEDPLDWRKKRLELTAEGRAFIDSLFKHEDSNAHIQEGK